MGGHGKRCATAKSTGGKCKQGCAVPSALSLCLGTEKQKQDCLWEQAHLTQNQGDWQAAETHPAEPGPMARSSAHPARPCPSAQLTSPDTLSQLDGEYLGH